jgi:glyoxylate reductase
MSHPVLVMTRPLPLPALSANGQTVDIRHVDGDPAVFDQAQVVLSTVLDSIDADLIAALPDSVSLIANIGVGYDNIDLQAATARGIAVSNTPVVTEDTADLAFLLILAATRRLYANEAMLRAGEWGPANAMSILGQSVQGKTLGIIGLGDIGQAVARRARAFNMDIVYHGPKPRAEAEAALGARYFAGLNDMLAVADIVSLHCPLTPATTHIMNVHALEAMKPGTVLINTGRGALVDEGALVNALNSGHLAAAGLDVFEHEPGVHPGLLGMSKVTLSPHIGSATTECRGAMVGCALQNAIACFEGRELVSPVPMP